MNVHILCTQNEQNANCIFWEDSRIACFLPPTSVVGTNLALQLTKFGCHDDNVVHARQEPGVDAGQLVQLP